MTATQRSIALDALLVAVLAATLAGINAWLEQHTRVLELDLDHWGTMISRLEQDRRLAVLFSDPSMWKGPVVPALMGLAYWVWPDPAAPLLLNVVAMGMAAGVLMIVFRDAGLPRLAVWAGLVGWAGFRPHHYVVGYYFAEPMLTLLVALLLAGVSRAVRGTSVAWALFTGLVSGTLLLSRAPYLGALAIGLPALLWWWPDTRRRRTHVLAAYVAGTLIIWAPWPIRNAVRFHAFIPFTTESGQVFFEGFYLPGDDGTTEAVRGSDEYRGFEQTAARLPAEERLTYWHQLAWQHIVADPVGQLRLAVRKAIRFWTYLPDHSWQPSWGTLIAAAVYLPLAVVAVRRSRSNVTVVAAAIVVASLWAMHTVLHSEMRYNFPVLPLVFVLAATALVTKPGASPWDFGPQRIARSHDGQIAG